MENSDPFHRLASEVRNFISNPALELRDGPHQCSARFERLAFGLFQLQFQHCAVYQGFCRELGKTPEDISDWREVPALPAAAFKEHAVTSIPPDRRAVLFQSSGTSRETRSRHWHSGDSLAVYEQSLGCGFALAAPGWLRDPRQSPPPGLSLTPPLFLAADSSLVWMIDSLARRLRWPAESFLGTIGPAGAWTLPAERIHSFLDQAGSWTAPALIFGTSLLWADLLEYLRAENVYLALPPGSQIMHTGGYKGRERAIARADLERHLTERLGIAPDNILREYGMTELSSQAYARADSRNGVRGAYQFPPWARSRIVSPETGLPVAEGEKGLLQVCDLANVYSVMMLQTEDLARQTADGFELLGRLEGAEIRGCSLMSI